MPEATPRLWLDVTKSGAAKHRSGLTRVTQRLQAELGGAARAHPWGTEIPVGGWYLTAEVFAPAERPGFAAWMKERPAKLAAIYHDSIPLKLPHITWPQAVARHPAYVTMLAGYDRVWAVSQASKEELESFWRWQGRRKVPPVDVIALGSDFGGTAPGKKAERPKLLCVGIVEPRKNQSFLAEVAEALWTEGVEFELHVVGRVNPHFGEPIVKQFEALRAKGRALVYEGAVTDEALAKLYRESWACVFPTMAEGCGLPLLEALRFGTPCVASDLPSISENAGGGGAVLLTPNDRLQWISTLRRVLTDAAWRAQLEAEAARRYADLPLWAGTARTVLQAL